MPATTSSSQEISQISRCFIKPAKHIPEAASKAPIYLTNWDLQLLTGSYIQTGLLFSKPPTNKVDHDQPNSINTIVGTLKDSLSKVLVHFYLLTGCLKTHRSDFNFDSDSTIKKQGQSYYIYLDCLNPQGAEFVHAYVDLTIDDILSPINVPKIVRSFFLYGGAVNHDGHTLPLLGIQITELIDGYFIGCSFNHVVGDGTSFWHFMNSWSEISRSKGDNSISNPPILKRWFLEGRDQIINLPYSSPEDFIHRLTTKSFTERVFHFSAQSLSKLKSKANEDYKTETISTFQSLCALVWRSITRVRGFQSSDEISQCLIIMGGRSRLVPPISNNYFGNCIGSGIGTAEVGELLSRDLGWSALLCNKVINDLNNDVVRKKVESWIESPTISSIGKKIMSGKSLFIGLSRFDVYGNDFGWGKPVAVRRGIAFDGRINGYPGFNGGIDLFCCLSPEIMNGLGSDQEFMSFVSPAVDQKKL